MHRFNGQNVPLVPIAYFELITRLRSAAMGLIKLIGSIEQNPELEFSAALTIRTMIVDFFIGLRGQDLKEQLKTAGKTDNEIMMN